MSVVIRGVTYEMTTEEEAIYAELVAQGVDETTALQIAKGDFEDIVVEGSP